MSNNFTSPFKFLVPCKRHKCAWCDEPILVGAGYHKAVSSYDGDFLPLKFHPECKDAWDEWCSEADYDDTWNPGYMTRGCHLDPFGGDNPCGNCHCGRSKIIEILNSHGVDTP